MATILFILLLLPIAKKIFQTWQSASAFDLGYKITDILLCFFF